MTKYLVKFLNSTFGTFFVLTLCIGVLLLLMIGVWVAKIWIFKKVMGL